MIGSDGRRLLPPQRRRDKYHLEMRAIGSEGQFHIDVEREFLSLFGSADQGYRPTLDPEAGRYDCDGPPNTLVDVALGKDVDDLSLGEVGAHTVEILDACYRSARGGKLKPVRVSR